MKSIRTILACIRKADQTYNLINHGDKIVIGLSGGKDSVVLTYALTLYSKFSHTDFTIQPVMLDLGFPGFDSTEMENFCKKLGLNLLVSDCKDVYTILKIQEQKQGLKHLPCSICSRMKKAAINKVAKEIGYNKVAFAHHSDDAIETLLLNEIHGGRIATFSPKMFLENAEIEFIRPLLLCNEKDISSLIKEEQLPVCSSKCPADKTTTREDIKGKLVNLYKDYPMAKQNFVDMLTNYKQEDIWSDQICYQLNQEGLYVSPVTSPYQSYISSYIRSVVFIKEQNIDPEIEYNLEEEENAFTFLLFSNKTPIGTIRYRQIEHRLFKIERFAILKQYRKNGYGDKLFSYIEEKLKSEYTPCSIIIHAQEYLQQYYLSKGYKKEGSSFIEANISHIKMKKDL